MSPHGPCTGEEFDRACRYLRTLAMRHGNHEVSIHVRPDGRVEIMGVKHLAERWYVRADLDPDSADPLPSVALAAVGK